MAAGTGKSGGNRARKSAKSSARNLGAKRTKKPVASTLMQMGPATTGKPAIKSAKRTTKKRTKKPKASSLTQLGSDVRAAASPDVSSLETAPNPHPGDPYLVRFTAPEFTALCPMTGQPDFAHLVIDYVPAKSIVESKSLKLFLTSFRNHGAFHEDCTLAIAKCIMKTARPKWLRIGGYWYPRGGIPIDIFYQTGAAPKGVWLPEQNVPPYRGRG